MHDLQPFCGANRGLPLRRCAAFNSPLFPESFEIALVCGIVGAALLHLSRCSDRTTSSVCVCVCVFLCVCYIVYLHIVCVL